MTRDEEIVIFHYRLGVAITQWSYIEAIIGDIVIHLFTRDELNREAIGVSYFSLEGFRIKLKFADEVVKRKLAGTEHLADWEKLFVKASKQSSQRNNLAHWSIGKYWDCDPGKRVVLRPWIAPKPKNEAERKKPPLGSMRIMDLVHRSENFSKLASSFREFFASVFAVEHFRELPEQPDDPMTVHKLKLQIREVFSVGPTPSDQK